MKKVNWKTYKFHCSSLPTLMSNGRSKTEKLSATAKSALREIWIKERFGRENITSSKYTEKGLFVEQDSLDIATKVLKTGFLPKNETVFTNAYLVGTPDTVNPVLLDVKSCWDIWSFMSKDSDMATKDYYWQVWGYMWLTKAKTASLVYALVDTPDHITEDELYRLSFKVGQDNVEKYRNNYQYGDIPAKMRVKHYEFSFVKEEITLVKEQLKECRLYLESLEKGINA